MTRWAILLGALLAATDSVGAWGYAAHRIVGRNAAAALPEGMRAFYAAAGPALSDASIEPDSVQKDREGDREKRRHYIDLDELGSPPFADLPVEEGKARALYGAAKLEHAGLLPWRITEVYGMLREAFAERAWDKVVRLSGWLSHYVADAYQPLHTTRNHDGQASCNLGIHAAFETDMIDRGKALYMKETAAPASFTPRAIAEPGRFMLAEIVESFDLVDEVLGADTQAVLAVKRQRKDYYAELESRAGPIARRQLGKAVQTSASLWYSAWTEAGSPPLPGRPPAATGSGPRRRGPRGGGLKAGSP
jgi:hypothetical protein